MIDVDIKYLKNYDLKNWGEIKINEFFNFNLNAAINEQISLLPFVGFPYQSNDFKPKLIPTGIAINIPIGYQLIVKTNPELILKGITILDSLMVLQKNKIIMEIKLLFINFNSDYYKLFPGEKIAIGYLQKINEIKFNTKL